MKDGFLKAAALSPALRVADCAYNVRQITDALHKAAARGVKLAVFPEFCLTGYTCGDLFLQETLLEGALKALETVRRESEEIAAVIVVGLPLRVKGKLYNVAAVVNAGDVLAFVPKTYIPNYSEFYEQRHFVSADTLSGMENVLIKAADGEGPARHRSHFSVRRAAAVHLRRRDLRGSVGAESAVYYIGADGRAHYRQPVCFR